MKSESAGGVALNWFSVELGLTLNETYLNLQSILLNLFLHTGLGITKKKKTRGDHLAPPVIFKI